MHMEASLRRVAVALPQSAYCIRMACHLASTVGLPHRAQQLVSLRAFQPLTADECSRAARGSRSIRAPSSAKPDVPWVLMGRTVSLGERDARDGPAQPGDDGPLKEAELLKEFSALLPEVAENLTSANRSMALKLAADAQNVAARLVALKVMFPSSNVLRMVGMRPSLLLEDEFEKIEGNFRQLQAALPGADVEHMVQEQPLFLIEDVEVILAELKSLQPDKDTKEVVKLLGQDPKLANLLVLRLDVRSQVRAGVPRLRYP